MLRHQEMWEEFSDPRLSNNIGQSPSLSVPRCKMPSDLVHISASSGPFSGTRNPHTDPHLPRHTTPPFFSGLPLCDFTWESGTCHSVLGSPKPSDFLFCSLLGEQRLGSFSVTHWRVST